MSYVIDQRRKPYVRPRPRLLLLVFIRFVFDVVETTRLQIQIQSIGNRPKSQRTSFDGRRRYRDGSGIGQETAGIHHVTQSADSFAGKFQ